MLIQPLLGVVLSSDVCAVSIRSGILHVVVSWFPPTPRASPFIQQTHRLWVPAGCRFL